MSTYENNIKPIDSLYKSVQRWVSSERYYDTFKVICDNYDKDWQEDLHQNHWENSLVRILLQIHERIELTDCLKQDMSTDFLRLIEYHKLITYLRLTCFDLLGQPNEWMIFPDWVNSKKKKSERDSIIEQIKFVDNIGFTLKLFKEYQKVYSVKNSFFRFLNVILPIKFRDDLLNCIKIVIREESGIKLKLYDPTIQDKENFLFKIRNDYTHKVYAKSSIQSYKSIKSDEKWNFRETIYKDNLSYSISTSIDFEDKLKEIVYIGIAEIIKN